MFSPSAIIEQTVASPVTFTTVLNMSKILSTGKMMAIQAGFKPTESNTIISITKPALGTAADPIDAKVDRKSTRLNSSHVRISYAVFCLKKKKKKISKRYKKCELYIEQSLENVVAILSARSSYTR